MRIRNLVAALAPAALVVALLSAPAGATTSTPLTPQQDPFYRPPVGWSSKPAGTILRSRTASLATFSALPQKVRAWQLLYRTTNHAGHPMAAVTTVMLPVGHAASRIVSYQVAEDSSARQCAMSYTFQQGAGLDGASNQAEILEIDGLVASGYAVSVPDYEGLDAEWGAPRQPGYAILDGLRASEHFASLGLTGVKTPAALWGYSGGSLASGWAAELQPSYAPELNIKGVALGGFATNVSAVLGAVNGGPFAGFMPAILPGMLRSDPALATLFAQYLTPAGRTLFAQGSTLCEQQALMRYAFLDLGHYLTVPLSTFLAEPAVKAAFAAAGLGHTAPRAPLFVYHAVHDEIVPISGTDRIVSSYCARGTSITYTRDQLSEHVSLNVTAVPAVLNWLHQRLNGVTQHGCSTNTVLSMALTPTAVGGLSPTLRGVLLGLTELNVSG